MDYWGSLLCALLFVIQVEARTDTPIRQCKKINSCACRNDDGSVVDLHNLARNDGTAAYVNVSDGPGTDFFFWNPCSSFSLSDPACHDVAVCMVRRNNGLETFNDIGRQESANFNVDNKGSLTLVYTHTKINLKCSTNSEYLTTEGEQSGLYLLSLASRYACPIIPDHHDTTTHYSTSSSMGDPTWIILSGTLLVLICIGDSNTNRLDIPEKNIQNKSVPGLSLETVENVVNSIIIPHDSRIGGVVVHLGTNDIPKKNKNDVVTSAKMTLDLISQKWPKCPIAYSSILPRVGNSAPVKRINMDAKYINRQILDYCRKSKYMHYLDNNDMFLQGKKTVNSLYDAGDPRGIHISEEGADQLYLSMTAFLIDGVSDEDSMSPDTATLMRNGSKMTSQSARSVTLLVVLVGLFVGIIAQGPVPIGQCTKIDACSCVYDDGTIVKLQAIDRKDGKPNFSNVSNADNTEYYSWNPCTPFTYPSNNSACENVAVCMIRQGIPNALFYNLGNQDSAQFLVDSNGTLKLTYTADQGDYKRVAEITLQCMGTSKFDFFVAEGEQDESNDTVIFKLLLASKYACAYAPNLNPSVEVSSLSGGVIFVIVLFSLIGAYIIFGVMFQAFIKKETGKRLCPNHEFWCKIPELCKGSKTGGLKSESGAKYDSI
ncbi:uncharacterized protein LOC123531016 [Mercenaria mercenaria]|uniref:uncharacterized protein LOC123531016 n=1 Tax=Mercenaria mercenaria TaxID=6596 RepID=UPI00234E8178|nr:uncharacterized protein LOC123531016 [Mercenaria mercenaria]